MYFVPIRCNVTNVNSPKVIGTPQPPVWCQDDPANCVSGPKQLIVWNQAEGNNIVVEGYDLSGSPKSPGYNSKCGWADGGYTFPVASYCLLMVNQVLKTTFLRTHLPVVLLPRHQVHLLREPRHIPLLPQIPYLRIPSLRAVRMIRANFARSRLQKPKGLPLFDESLRT